MNGSRSYVDHSQSYADGSGSYVTGTSTFITYVEASSMEEKATRIMEKDSSLECKDSFGVLSPFFRHSGPSFPRDSNGAMALFKRALSLMRAALRTGRLSISHVDLIEQREALAEPIVQDLPALSAYSRSKRIGVDIPPRPRRGIP